MDFFFLIPYPDTDLRLLSFFNLSYFKLILPPSLLFSASFSFNGMVTLLDQK